MLTFYCKEKQQLWQHRLHFARTLYEHQRCSLFVTYTIEPSLNPPFWIDKHLFYLIYICTWSDHYQPTFQLVSRISIICSIVIIIFKLSSSHFNLFTNGPNKMSGCIFLEVYIIQLHLCDRLCLVGVCRFCFKIPDGCVNGKIGLFLLSRF